MKTARVLLSAASPQFNPVTIRNWREEGFTISYLPYDGNWKSYAHSLMAIADTMEFGDNIALIGRYIRHQLQPKLSNAWCIPD